jgi:hypothetical protein
MENETPARRRTMGQQFEAEESVNRYTGQPNGSWCVVNYRTGMVRAEALNREQAEELATRLNAEAEADEGE